MSSRSAAFAVKVTRFTSDPRIVSTFAGPTCSAAPTTVVVITDTENPAATADPLPQTLFS